MNEVTICRPAGFGARQSKRPQGRRVGGRPCRLLNRAWKKTCGPAPRPRTSDGRRCGSRDNRIAVPALTGDECPPCRHRGGERRRRKRRASPPAMRTTAAGDCALAELIRARRCGDIRSDRLEKDVPPVGRECGQTRRARQTELPRAWRSGSDRRCGTCRGCRPRGRGGASTQTVYPPGHGPYAEGSHADGARGGTTRRVPRSKAIDQALKISGTKT